MLPSGRVKPHISLSREALGKGYWKGEHKERGGNSIVLGPRKFRRAFRIAGLKRSVNENQKCIGKVH